MKKSFVFLVLSLLAAPLWAAHSLTGKIVDGQTSDPLDFVNVALYEMGSEVPLSGVVTDETGTFLIPSVKDGKYYITLDLKGLDLNGQLGYLGGLKYFLTGTKQTEYTIASTSGLLDIS